MVRRLRAGRAWDDEREERRESNRGNTVFEKSSHLDLPCCAGICSVDTISMRAKDPVSNNNTVPFATNQCRLCTDSALPIREVVNGRSDLRIDELVK
jgi:hypothetical protein